MLNDIWSINFFTWNFLQITDIIHPHHYEIIFLIKIDLSLNKNQKIKIDHQKNLFIFTNTSLYL